MRDLGKGYLTWNTFTLTRKQVVHDLLLAGKKKIDTLSIVRTWKQPG